MTSATDNLGAHLLGRIPSMPDERNWPLEAFLETGTASPLDVLAAAVAQSHAASAVKAWVAAATPLITGTTPPAPSPTPTPAPSSAVLWPDTEQLDQGQTGHCVGFGWAGFGNTLPVDDHFTNPDGDAIYYAAKVIDGEPGQENGSTVHSGAKAMQQRGRIKNYAWANSIDTVKTWVLKYGGVVFGTDWTTDMFNPDPTTGIITPTGQIAGGHCYLIAGYDPASDLFDLHNSWGSSWGLNGHAKIAAADLAQLLAQQGEACTAVELAA